MTCKRGLYSESCSKFVRIIHRRLQRSREWGRSQRYANAGLENRLVWRDVCAVEKFQQNRFLKQNSQGAPRHGCRTCRVSDEGVCRMCFPPRVLILKFKLSTYTTLKFDACILTVLFPFFCQQFLSSRSDRKPPTRSLPPTHKIT